MAQSHYTLKIVLEDINGDQEVDKAASSEESQRDTDVYAARKRAKDLLTFGQQFRKNPGNAVHDLLFGAPGEGDQMSKKGKAALGSLGVGMYNLAVDAISESYVSGLAHSGNTALMNSRANTASTVSEVAGFANAAVQGLFYGGVYGAVALLAIEALNQTADLKRQMLDVKMETQNWRDEARKTSERLGFDATKRNRYTYNY